MSRQVTEKTIRKFLNNENFKLSSTEVKTDMEITRLYLFGNCIARKNNLTNKIEITLAGYNTVTTRERLNGLPNVNICSKNFTPYLNGKEIDSDSWYTV